MMAKDGRGNFRKNVSELSTEQLKVFQVSRKERLVVVLEEIESLIDSFEGFMYDNKNLGKKYQVVCGQYTRAINDATHYLVDVEEYVQEFSRLSEKLDEKHDSVMKERLRPIHDEYAARDVLAREKNLEGNNSSGLDAIETPPGLEYYD